MKKGDARRDEVLAAAERLFSTKGYEKTSVQDILDEIHFSKGGFYHHFDSKLAVLEAICERRAQESCETARQAVEAYGTAVDKLNALLHTTPLWSGEDQGFVSLLIRVAYREDGALMREKMKESQLAGRRPMLERILSEGVRSKEFFVTDLPFGAELILRLYMQFTDEVAFLLSGEESEERLIDALVRKLNVYRSAIERVLIAPFGSIVLFEAKELQLLAGTVLRDRVRQRADALLAGETL
ncbi:MAG: TetR/AcrR family transcriptional regulator [Clostridia bacterium]|nr:TetR/AcrR family transcriptional regulator [Clostridia bacterium]